MTSECSFCTLNSPPPANPVNCLEESARDLTNFLWSRRRAVEDVELRARARGLAKKFQEDIECNEIDQDSPELQEGEEERHERLRHQVLAELRRTIPRWKAVRFCTRLRSESLSLSPVRSWTLDRALEQLPVSSPHRAGRRAWGASLHEIVCVDTSPSMHQLAGFLMRGGSDAETEHSRGVYFRHFLPVSPKVKFDLVVSAYSLSELPTCADRCRVLETLWRKTQGFLVLIENGTRDGHQILMEARNLVLTADEEPLGHVFAPCSHDLACPKLAGSVPQPCNFSQAYHPLPFSWNPGVKQELFSYLVLGRGARTEGEDWPRVIRPVLCRPRHVHAHLCCPDGTLQHLVLTARKSGIATDGPATAHGEIACPRPLVRPPRQTGVRSPAVSPGRSPETHPLLTFTTSPSSNGAGAQSHVGHSPVGNLTGEGALRPSNCNNS
ncbi:ribosome assembly protein METTL17, mitochondrial [Hemitrygon akajei]|uniref:ribosome assembly protein METTL17, mitochondrial n=1 Tax=Hemitrygon akajei TaxID=2704970 RepID=UPI003BF9F070